MMAKLAKNKNEFTLYTSFDCNALSGVKVVLAKSKSCKF